MATPSKGMFGDRLSDIQYEYLKANIASWYNSVTVVFSNTSYSVVNIDVYNSNEGKWTLTAINREGTITTTSTFDETNYRATVWKGDPGSANYLYLFGENGYVDVSSYVTLGFGVMPVTRADYSLTRIRETEWTWLNLYYVLNALHDIHAISPLQNEEKRQLAYEWDSQMSYRTISPYFCEWVAGSLDETEMAAYFGTLFRDKWNGLYDALKVEYDPTLNYKMHETEHVDELKDEDTTSSDSSTSSAENSNTTTSSSTTNEDVYAFNSSTESPDSKNTSSDSTTDSGTNSSTSTNSGTNAFAADNDTDRERNAEGNTGVYSYQKLVEDEWALRQKVVLEEIRKDITETLTLPIYI